MTDEITDKAGQIEGLNADIADKAGQIETLNADVADKAGQIETLNADVAEKAGEIETLNADVTDKARQIETLKADVADKAGKIETLNADVADKAGQIEVLNAEVADKAGQIEALNADVADKAGQIEVLNADVADKAGQIEVLNADVADKAGQIEALNADVTEKAGQIKSLHSDIDYKDGQIDTLTTDLNNKTDEIDKLTMFAKEKTDQIAALNADAADKAGQIEALNANVADKASKIESLEADIAEKDSQIEELKAVITDTASLIDKQKAEGEENTTQTANELKTMKEKLEEKEKEISALTAEIEGKKNQTDSLTADADKQLDKIKMLINVIEDETKDSADGSNEERKLLAIVNGEYIWSDNKNLSYAYANYVETAESYGMDTSSEDVTNMLKQYSMQYAIQYALILQKAKELGLDTVTDEEKAKIESEVKDSWDQGVKSLVDQLGTVTEESTEEEKAAAYADAEGYIKQYYGYTPESYVAETMSAEINNMVIGRLQDKLTEGQEISDADVQKYFDDLVAENRETYQDAGTYEFYTQYYGQDSYYTPEGYRGIIHILLPVDETLLSDWKDLTARLEEQNSAEEDSSKTETAASEPVTQEMVDAAAKAIMDSVQPKVDEIKAKLEAGTPFVDLIKEYGTDSGMQDESKLAQGYPVHKDSILWDPAFTAAAMALEKVGDVSEPVLGQSGVHILQYLKDIPGGPVELTDAMKEEFRATLMDEAKSDALQAGIDEWEKAAIVVYTDEGKQWELLPEEAEEENAGLKDITIK